MYCKCCYKLLWWEHKRIDSLFFFNFPNTSRIYIYVYYLLAQSIITVCVFHYYTQVSAEREERQLKKNCISSNPPSASISSALQYFLKIVVCLIRKKNTLIFCHISEAMFWSLLFWCNCSNVLVQGLLFHPNLTIEFIMNILCWIHFQLLIWL